MLQDEGKAAAVVGLPGENGRDVAAGLPFYVDVAVAHVVH